MVEEYSSYLQQSATLVEDDTKQLCECILSSSFGKYCEYLLPMGETFDESVQWQTEMRLKNLGGLTDAQ